MDARDAGQERKNPVPPSHANGARFSAWPGHVGQPGPERGQPRWCRGWSVRLRGGTTTWVPVEESLIRAHGIAASALPSSRKQRLPRSARQACASITPCRTRLSFHSLRPVPAGKRRFCGGSGKGTKFSASTTSSRAGMASSEWQERQESLVQVDGTVLPRDVDAIRTATG